MRKAGGGEHPLARHAPRQERTDMRLASGLAALILALAAANPVAAADPAPAPADGADAADVKLSARDVTARLFKAAPARARICAKPTSPASTLQISTSSTPASTERICTAPISRAPSSQASRWSARASTGRPSHPPTSRALTSPTRASSARRFSPPSRSSPPRRPSSPAPSWFAFAPTDGSIAPTFPART